MQRLEGILEETRRWRMIHRQAGNQIEAMACAIRERAILECIRIIQEPKK